MAVCMCSLSSRRPAAVCAVGTLLPSGFFCFFFFFQGSASRSIYRSAHDGPRAPPGDLKDFVCNLSLPRALSHIQKGLFLYFHPSLDGERECVAASASLICSRSRHAVNLFFFFSPTLSGATAVSPHNCTCWCVCRR